MCMAGAVSCAYLWQIVTLLLTFCLDFSCKWDTYRPVTYSSKVIKVHAVLQLPCILSITSWVGFDSRNSKYSYWSSVKSSVPASQTVRLRAAFSTRYLAVATCCIYLTTFWYNHQNDHKIINLFNVGSDKCHALAHDTCTWQFPRVNTHDSYLPVVLAQT